MRRALSIAVLVLFVRTAAYAQDSYEYFYNNSSSDEQPAAIATDMGLFLVPIRGAGSLFGRVSEFGFSAVRYNRRGYPREVVREYWQNIDISGLVSSSVDFSLLNILKRADFLRADGFGLDTGDLNVGYFAAKNEYPADVRSLVPVGVRVSVFTYNRRGRLGVRASAGGELWDGGYAGVTALHRWGRDPNVGGVFTQESSALAGFDWEPGRGHRISLSVGAVGNENGLRSYATREAFELTGDNYYNPSWGYYGGKERSARTSEKLNFYPMLNYEGRLSAATTLTASAWMRYGTERRGGLSWFDAQTPYPDYYRYMPGYEPSNPADAWRENDPRVTQIYWDQLVEQNLNRPGQAAYIFADRVEETTDIQLAVTARTSLGGHFGLTYGVRLERDGRECYRRMKSLLGARPMPDVDQYLLDDDIFGNLHLNDKRNPGRLVDEGDRFGYACRLEASKAEAYAVLNYTGVKFRASAGLEAGNASLHRNGHYEKELFPGSGSYGKSAEYKFNPYTVKVACGYSFSARHFAELSAMFGETAPYAGTVFLNPDYSNEAVARPTTVKMVSANLDYTAVLERATVNFSAFASRTSGESAVYRYWDDIAATYADMSLTGVDKLYYGAELAVQWDASARFTFDIAAALGSYTYDSDPVVTIVADATRHAVSTGAKSRLSGYRLATSPERALTGGVRYSSWGWVASLTASYAGGRYVAVSPLRRMERAFGLAESSAKHRDFIAQERLGDAFTMNLFLLRSFRVGAGTLTALASVNNLLGRTDIVYHGYEQMRVAKTGAAPNLNWKPFPNKYLYSYGRTYYVSLTYSF